MKEISKKYAVFVDEYLRCFNATEAYLRVYPKSSRESARANAARLIANDSIQEAIQARLDEVHMSADEALKLTADIARGDITEFITPFGNVDIDLLKQSGKGRLVKKIKQRTVTKIGKGEKDEDTEILETELELYPADSALDKILKVHGKYSDAPNININMSWKDFVNDNRATSDKQPA